MPWPPDNAFATPHGHIFKVAGEEIVPPQQYVPVREEDDQTTIKMLRQMVDALVEENGRLSEENLRLRSELERKKGCNG